MDPVLTLKEIDQEIAKLKAKAAKIVDTERQGVIDRMKEAIGYYGITAADLGLARGKTPTRAAGGKPKAVALGADAKPAKPRRAGAGAIKFKDAAGNTWSGFGPKPRWLTEALAGGKTLDDLKA